MLYDNLIYIFTCMVFFWMHFWCLKQNSWQGLTSMIWSIQSIHQTKNLLIWSMRSIWLHHIVVILLIACIIHEITRVLTCSQKKKKKRVLTSISHTMFWNRKNLQQRLFAVNIVDLCCFLFNLVLFNKLYVINP